MYILGLTTLGDSAATLIKDGEIVAAAEEERFSRRKHHNGYPYNAMQYCLDEAGIGIADVRERAWTRSVPPAVAGGSTLSIQNQ
jgi:carbamoyltransferase